MSGEEVLVPLRPREHEAEAVAVVPLGEDAGLDGLNSGVVPEFNISPFALEIIQNTERAWRQAALGKLDITDSEISDADMRLAKSLVSNLFTNVDHPQVQERIAHMLLQGLTPKHLYNALVEDLVPSELIPHISPLQVEIDFKPEHLESAGVVEMLINRKEFGPSQTILVSETASEGFQSLTKGQAHSVAVDLAAIAREISAAPSEVERSHFVSLRDNCSAYQRLGIFETLALLAYTEIEERGDTPEAAASEFSSYYAHMMELVRDEEGGSSAVSTLRDEEVAYIRSVLPSFDRYLSSLPEKAVEDDLSASLRKIA